jgi:phosphoglycolate phosphatase-like HAD superfamily hydrolase
MTYALLFDFDGVLVDSTPAYRAAWSGDRHTPSSLSDSRSDGSGRADQARGRRPPPRRGKTVLHTQHARKGGV